MDENQDNQQNRHEDDTSSLSDKSDIITLPEESKMDEDVIENSSNDTILVCNDNNRINIITNNLSESNKSLNLENSNTIAEVADVLEKIISTVCDKNDDSSNLKMNNSASELNTEILITKEIITIDNKTSSKDSINTKIDSSTIKKIDGNTPNENLFFIDKNTPLGALALQYDSSDEEDNGTKSISKTAVQNTENYRNKDAVVLSSDESSDSESDSSSSDSESDSESSSNNNNDNENDNDSSDDETTRVNSKRNRSNKVYKPKGEFDNLPPIEDLKISVPEVLCDPLGEVAWMVEQMVVVHPKPGKPTLNLDTVLFIEKGQRALGHIFDVFGQVTDPHYCVRFNSSEHIRECDIKVGMIVYYCPNSPYTSLVFLSELNKMKAIDDVGDDEAPQFSDDEEEQAYLKSLKNKSNKSNETANEVPKKRKRGKQSVWQSNHPWNSNREHQQNHALNHMNTNYQLQNTTPFYRTHHPWSRPRYQQPNSWHQQNSFSNNQWRGQRYSYYNQMQAYNEYSGSTHMEMQNPSYSQMQWNSHYQVPQTNTIPGQETSSTIQPYDLLQHPPPPPPPPLPPQSESQAPSPQRTNSNT